MNDDFLTLGGRSWPRHSASPQEWAEYNDTGPITMAPPKTASDQVEQAEQALKEARRTAKAQRKAAKAAACERAFRRELHDLGIETLRAVAADDRSPGDRMAAANRLLELGQR